tara:strand:- start:13 stop:405 length:393 start_codon:yes stop_codon:yes gene_type:complete
MAQVKTNKDIGDWQFDEGEVMSHAFKLLRKRTDKDLFQCIAEAVVNQFLETEKLEAFWLFTGRTVVVSENVNYEPRYEFNIVKLFEDALDDIDENDPEPELETLNKVKRIIKRAERKFSAIKTRHEKEEA